MFNCETLAGPTGLQSVSAQDFEVKRSYDDEDLRILLLIGFYLKLVPDAQNTTVNYCNTNNKPALFNCTCIS